MAGSNSVLGGGGFHHVAIKVSDFERTVKMYTEGLGFKEKIRWGSVTPEGDKRGIMLDTGDGNYLEVFGGGKVRPAATDMWADGVMIHFAIRTTKIEEAMQRAEAAGFKVTVAPKGVTIPSVPPTPIRIAFCHGPDGEVVELFQNDLT